MTAPAPAGVAEYLLALADDELILGHRNSEWTGHAPILEEDIAFSNIAQDELGHAAIWYGLVQNLTGESPDQMVFFRAPQDYRCAQMVELPRGDWAFSMVRQYLFDAAEMARLPLLAASRYAPLAEAAAKIRTEEIYHYRHTRAWVKRLGLGTPESHARMQAALDALWPYALQLFAPWQDESSLAADGFVPEPAEARQAWQALAEPHLTVSGLAVPGDATSAATRRDAHSPHLAALLEEMQSVARLEAPDADW